MHSCLVMHLLSMVIPEPKQIRIANSVTESAHMRTS